MAKSVARSALKIIRNVCENKGESGKKCKNSMDLVCELSPRRGRSFFESKPNTRIKEDYHENTVARASSPMLLTFQKGKLLGVKY
jgi:hypothetical protein